MGSPRRLTVCLSLFVTFCPTNGAAADVSDVFEFFQEEAKVVTASRRSEFVREAPAAVEVITSEDIRNSGAVNLWDFMRFRAGINVTEGRSGEGNRALVSVRGFPALFVDKLLVLLDGRSVYTGLSGGAVWESIPVQIQDIDRIEVIKGPNAALYGSNAGLGVINILTKKPQGRRALSGDVLGGNRGLHQEQVAVETTGKQTGMRLSYAHKAHDGFPATDGTETNDFVFSNKGNLRGFWNPTSQSQVEFFAGIQGQTLGILDAGDPQGQFEHHFQMLKFDYSLHSHSNLQALLSRRDDVRTFDPAFGGPTSVREYQYDVELLHRLDGWNERLHTIYGGSFRYTGIDSAQIFAGDPKQSNTIPRGFASQSWQILPKLNLIGAFSVEDSDTGATELAYQAAAVAHPLENHVFRASYGMAPTIPTLYQKAANQRATSLVQLVGNPDIQAQHLYAYEVGYQGNFLQRRMLVETNLFYMDIHHLSQTVVQSFVFAPEPLLTLSFNNANNAIARGSEVKWTYRWNSQNSIYANYTYESVSDATNQANVRQGVPEHAVNLGGRIGIPRGWSLTLNAGYKDKHTLYSQATNATLDIPAFWRLDARLGYVLPWYKDAELYMACQNLAMPTHVEFPDGLTVPRTYLGGITFKFGASQ
jgi:iron complex outermembrane recepter protein